MGTLQANLTYEELDLQVYDELEIRIEEITREILCSKLQMLLFAVLIVLPKMHLECSSSVEGIL